MSRCPATPLIVHDPYFSIWSAADRVNQDITRHWTGSPMGLETLVRIDGATFVLTGAVRGFAAAGVTAQEVHATRTVCRFEQNGVSIAMTFLTPALPHKLDILSRPASYVNFDVASLDGKPHQVEIAFGVHATVAVNLASEKITWSRGRTGKLDFARISSAAQNILGRTGDDLRIDWGHAYCAIDRTAAPALTVARSGRIAAEFSRTGSVGEVDDLLDSPLAACAGDSTCYLMMAASFALHAPAAGTASQHLIVAYDDVRAIEYFNVQLVAWYRRNGLKFADMLTLAEAEYATLAAECEAYDRELAADLAASGGSDYARLCILGFRQAIGAHKLVAGPNGEALFFSKENFSNGCIGTVDVTYPSAPLFLLTNPVLLEGMLIPILDYASSPRWRFPFAPHDLGTYPLANGQVYGGGEETEENQMPVEECGNMLLLAGALLKFHGDLEFVRRYRAKLAEWADYLAGFGLDPANQLCTDDFAGHLPHNANLSLKAILALGAYGQIAGALGDRAESEKYLAMARNFAARWQELADDGECYRLAFDRPGSWSQKYNLVWDKLLGLELFPVEVAKRETAFYRRKLDRCGLPLDSRKNYTKIDWEIWTATLTANDDDFQTLLAPVVRFLDETADRAPLTDWYECADGALVGWTDGHSGRKYGFRARSVVGGLFIKLLYDPALCRKYRARN